MRLDTVVDFLDAYLHVADEIADAPEALNGLQVANVGEVSHVAAAVDFCEATARRAGEQRADLLLVHHGMFWGGLRPLVGPAYRRVAGLVKSNIALYSAHLPLDRHPEVGNNQVLARLLGIKVRGDFGSYHGAPAGVWGEYRGGGGGARDELTWALTKTLGAAPRVFPFGPDRVQRVGIVTGSGGSLIPQAAAAGLDTFVTGEGQHWTFFDAEELGINVYYAGHYATETVGIKALAEHVSKKFDLPWVFLDHPTGL
jgi:dinuclear metal center YbgI/SA1388 family protein